LDAVDRAAARGVDEARHSGRPRRLEQVDGPDHVRGRVEAGVGHRLADVDLRCEVKDDAGPLVGDQCAHVVAVADVRPVQPRARGERSLEIALVTR
jgi:hypothetical protein